MKTYDEILASLPKARRERIKAGADIIRRDIAMRDLRKQMASTQAEVAVKLGIDQSGVARMERRGDMLLSTLESYISSLGGELKLVAEFPGLPAVQLLKPTPRKPSNPPSGKPATGSGLRRKSKAA